MKKIIATISLFLFPLTAFAITSPIQCADIPCLMGNFVTLLYAVGLPLSALMVVIGGLQIILGGGDVERIKRGRQTITYSVVGLVIILMGLGIDQLIRNII